jgi:type IV secretory pathway VirB3-like protein
VNAGLNGMMVGSESVEQYNMIVRAVILVLHVVLKTASKDGVRYT